MYIDFQATLANFRIRSRIYRSAYFRCIKIRLMAEMARRKIQEM